MEIAYVGNLKTKIKMCFQQIWKWPVNESPFDKTFSSISYKMETKKEKAI